MIAILKKDLEEIKDAWAYCGFQISEQEIFDILEGRA